MVPYGPYILDPETWRSEFETIFTKKKNINQMLVNSTDLSNKLQAIQIKRIKQIEYTKCLKVSMLRAQSWDMHRLL